MDLVAALADGDDITEQKVNVVYPLFPLLIYVRVPSDFLCLPDITIKYRLWFTIFVANPAIGPPTKYGSASPTGCCQVG